MSLLSILTVLFVALKLTNFIHWDWWMVLLPTISQFVVWIIATTLIVWRTTK